MVDEFGAAASTPLDLGRKGMSIQTQATNLTTASELTGENRIMRVFQTHVGKA